MSTILLVDDDRDICALLGFRLVKAGYDVRVEHDGEAGFAAAGTAAADLIILDWMMPRLSGLEVCLQLRADERFSHVPIVMLTAKAQEIDMQRGLAAGADDFVVKPFSSRDLLSRLEAVLTRTRG